LKRFTLTKQERLSSHKLIKELFEKGSSFYFHPIKTVFLKAPPELEAKAPQILFSVSKRNFKKAVDRNRIKRLMREAYRLNKLKLFSEHNTDAKLPAVIGFIYTSKEKMSFKEIENKLILSLKRFSK